MVVRDRKGHTADFKSARLDANHVREALMPLIDREAVLCSDGAAVYARFARTQGTTHQVVHARPVSAYAKALSISRTSTPTTAA